jgi:hypothetical protein
MRDHVACLPGVDVVDLELRGVNAEFRLNDEFVSRSLSEI